MARPTRRTVAREDLAPVILDTAAMLFADRGFEATTMQDIAARVGITAPGLYHYFPSKRRLLFEVLERALDALIRRLDAAVSDARPYGLTTELRALIVTHVTFQVEEAAESAVYGSAFYGSRHMLNALTDDERARLAELQHRSFTLLRDILTRGVEAGIFNVPHVTSTALAIYGMGEHVPAWFKSSGPLTIDEVGRLYADLALRMVLPVPAATAAPVETAADRAAR